MYYYNPKVHYLLITKSNDKEVVTYGNQQFKLPKIGPRPPYYTNPRYESFYPVI